MRPLLSARALAALRRIDESSMQATLQIQRAVLVPDGAGGQRSGDPEIVATVKGVLHPSSNTPDERAIADQLAGRSVQTIGVPIGTDVRPSDRLIELASGRTFEVVQLVAATNAAELMVTCIEE